MNSLEYVITSMADRDVDDVGDNGIGVGNGLDDDDMGDSERSSVILLV